VIGINIEYMPKLMNSPQLVSILQIISNSNSLKVLSTIANSTSGKCKAMKNLLIISKKQFYSLTGEMLRTGQQESI
jgi:hypothetical protein